LFRSIIPISAILDKPLPERNPPIDNAPAFIDNVPEGNSKKNAGVADERLAKPPLAETTNGVKRDA